MSKIEREIKIKQPLLINKGGQESPLDKPHYHQGVAGKKLRPAILAFQISDYTSTCLT